MPEITPDLQKEINEFAGLLSAKFAQPEFIPGCQVVDVGDIDEYATNNGWIEAICGQHNRQRVRWKSAESVGTASYIDVVHFPDRRLFEAWGLGGSGAVSAPGASVWPLPGKLNIGATEYSTVALALGAQANGDLIITGEGSLACNDQTIDGSDGDVFNFLGGGMESSIWTTSTGTYVITLSHTGTPDPVYYNFQNMGFLSTLNLASAVVRIDNDVVCTFINCKAKWNGAAGGTNEAWFINNGTTYLYHCIGEVLTGATKYSLRAFGGGTVYVYGGYYPQDVLADSGGAIILQGPQIDGTVTGCTGWYYDASGNLITLDTTGKTSGVWQVDESALLKIKRATLAAAVTAAASGDTIKLDTDTYSVAASQNIGVSLTIEGDGPEATIYTTSVSNATVFDITADSITVTFKDLTIRHTGGGANATGIFSNNASVTVILDNCVLEISSGAPTTGRGLWIESGTWILRNGSKIAITSGTSKYGIYNDVGAATVTLGAGCEVGGATADIYGDQSGSTVTLNSAVLTNGLVSWAGVINWEPENKIVKNLLYSSMTHSLWQEGTTLSDIADDTYGPDSVWLVLNKDNAPDVTGQAGGATDPFTTSFRCTFDSASAQAGIVQFLEFEDTYPLRGQVVSLSADLWGTNVTTLRMAVIVWTSTADSVTSDVVGTWGTGNPTLATNWAYIGTPAAITISSTRARYAVNNLTVPTNANNIGVFIWTDAAEASGDLWNVARVQLERGPVATEFVARQFEEELALIQRYLESPLDLSVAVPTTTQHVSMSVWGNTIGNGQQYGQQFFKTVKRAAPTVTVYPYTTVANTSRISNNSGTDQAANSGVAVSITAKQFGIQNNSGGNVTTGNNLILFSWKADARL